MPEAVVGRVERWGVLRGSWWLRTQLFPPDGLDDWSTRHLPALVELERAAPDAAAGETLLHLDLRADNLLIGPAGVTVVDWPHARLGAAWVDRAFLAPSLAMQGGPSPESLMARGGAGPPPGDAELTAVVAAMAGFFTWQALEPPPLGLPTLGDRTSGVMGTEELRDRVVAAGQRVGDDAWPMPLPDYLRSGLDSKVADIANVTGERGGGMLAAGVFLREFVADGVQWAHVDVASPAFNTGRAWGYTPKGGTGVPVRTLLATLEELAADS